MNIMVDPLLALCARSDGHPEQIKELAIQGNYYKEWSTIPLRAEHQSLAPLAYHHLKDARQVLPKDTRQILMGLTLRHRRANRIRYSVLAKILEVLKREDIEVLILKGAALARTVYSRPGLRPMRDMDILVKESDALRTQKTLIEMGFVELLTQSKADYSGHHLPITQRVVEGLTVSIEVHQRLLPDARYAYNYKELRANARSFSVNEVATLTLAHEDMLWHIYRHSFAYPLIEQSIRLIWVADFVSLVEKYVNEIDWDKVKEQYPQIWHVLPVFHGLTPWSDQVLSELNINVAPPPQGVGHTFQGWPKSSLAVQRRKGTRRFLEDTFWPSEWWTWLYYGVDRRSIKWRWIRLLRHPLHIAGWVLQYLRSHVSRLYQTE